MLDPEQTQYYPHKILAKKTGAEAPVYYAYYTLEIIHHTQVGETTVEAAR